MAQGPDTSAGSSALGRRLGNANHLYRAASPSPSHCLDAAAGDDDGAVNTADTLSIFAYPLREKADAGDPHPGCGGDPRPMTGAAAVGFSAFPTSAVRLQYRTIRQAAFTGESGSPHYTLWRR